MNITDLNDDVLLLIVDAIADIDAKVGKRKVAKLVALPLASFAITCKKLHALTAPKLFCKLLHGCYDANCGRAIDRRTSDNDLKFLSKSNTILRCCRNLFLFLSEDAAFGGTRHIPEILPAMSRLVDLTLYVTFEQAHGLKDLLRTSPMSFPSVKKFTTSQLAIWFKDYCPNLELLVFVYDPDMSDLFIYDLDVLLDPPGEFSDGVSGMVTQAIAVKLSQGSLVKKLRIQCPYTSNADLEVLSLHLPHLQGLEIPKHKREAFRQTIKTMSGFASLKYIRIPLVLSGVLSMVYGSCYMSFCWDLRCCKIVAREMFVSCRSLETVVFGEEKSCTIAAVRDMDGKVVGVRVVKTHETFLSTNRKDLPELDVDEWGLTVHGRRFMAMLDGADWAY